MLKLGFACYAQLLIVEREVNLFLSAPLHRQICLLRDL